MGKALGGSRQLIIEASTGVMPPLAAPPAPVVQPTPTAPAPLETERPHLPKTEVVPAVVDAPTPITKLTTQEPAKPPPPIPSPVAISKPVQAEPVQNPANPSPASGLDRQAKNLADFFNGQVLDVDTDGIN